MFRLRCYEKADTEALSKGFGLAFNGGVIAERTSTSSVLGFLSFKIPLGRSGRPTEC